MPQTGVGQVVTRDLAGPLETGAPAAGPVRRRSRAKTEAALHSVAAKYFASKGYAATTIEEIAHDVGIHKTTVFHYFPSKQELLVAVLDRGLSGYVASLQHIASSDASAFTRLVSAVRNHLDFVFDHGVELQIFLRERKHLSGKAGQDYLRMSERYQAIFTDIVRECMVEGPLRQGDAAVMSLFLLGAANWITEWYQPGGRLTRTEVTEQFIGLFLGYASDESSLLEPGELSRPDQEASADATGPGHQ